MKNEFVAIVAHDLRSPISVISGFADTLLARGDEFDEDKRTEALEMIVRSSKGLSTLIDDVLEVSRIEAGQLHLDPAEVQVGDLIRRAAESVVPGDEWDRLSFVVPDPLPPVFVDEARTWQVVTNLVSNAIKYSQPGSPIEVEVAIEEDDYLIVSVHDHGPGIAPEDMPKLFQRFARVGPGGSSVQGTGLGLYICRRLVEAQGGRIWAESVPGVGSTFAFSLPTSAQQARRRG
jgi:signal transduction histidine kinase